MEPTFKTPLLVATTSKGGQKFWQGAVYVQPDGLVFTTTEYWQVSGRTESAHQNSAPTYVVPKSQPTALDQARFNITSDMQKKLDKGYAVVAGQEGDIAVAEQVRPPILPMLAHPYKDKAHKITYPVFVQAKENGVRCLFDGTTFWSRQGNAFLDGVVDHLRFDTRGLIFDGELLLPEPRTFQETISAVKKVRPESALLQYRVYDVYDPSHPHLTYRDRLEIGEDLLYTLDHPAVWWVETLNAESEEEMRRLHADWTVRGYEGSIVRAKDGVYKPDHRSDILLKVKDTNGAEYEIVGFGDGVGKDSGAVIFTCITPEGKTFDVRPKGTMESRRELFAQGQTNVGKRLTVRYQTLTDGGVPLFPVGIALRNYE